MGYCYYMGMDWYFEGNRFYEHNDFNMHKPISYTLYKTNLLGENNLFLMQEIQIPFNDDTNETYGGYMTYLLNDGLCKTALEDKKFDIFKDRKFIGGLYHASSTLLDDNEFFGIIKYKGNDYVLNFLDVGNGSMHITLGYDIDKQKNKEYSQYENFTEITENMNTLNIAKCKRFYYYYNTDDTRFESNKAVKECLEQNKCSADD